MEHEHTPGPWNKRYVPIRHEWEIIGPKGEVIAIVKAVADTEVDNANARLIALAPELAEQYRKLRGGKMLAKTRARLDEAENLIDRIDGKKA